MANIRTAMNRGVVDFLTKPVDLQDLDTTIQKSLDDIAKCAITTAAERAGANLSRYSSPNIVEILAERDEPLGAVWRQTVAVLFADIVGFTSNGRGDGSRAGGKKRLMSRMYLSQLR
jgi:adenylate cyclase